MSMGPGKYDAECLALKHHTRARGAFLIVFEGAKGSGASCKMDAEVVGKMPMLLRQIADEMERDNASLLGKDRG